MRRKERSEKGSSILEEMIKGRKNRSWVSVWVLMKLRILLRFCLNRSIKRGKEIKFYSKWKRRNLLKTGIFSLKNNREKFWPKTNKCLKHFYGQKKKFSIEKDLNDLKNSRLKNSMNPSILSLKRWCRRPNPWWKIKSNLCKLIGEKRNFHNKIFLVSKIPLRKS
jgi:hypothetical protein